MEVNAKNREVWVDNVKVIACILVVAGHFWQSMVTSGLAPENDFYLCFIQTVYYFHVKLFFICSGYLFQKYSRVNSLKSWTRNTLKKLLALGVPYFTFTVITWILKNIFADSVNSEIDGLAGTLFLHPIPPYWYLYALFFIFLITPTFKNGKCALIGLVISLTMKIYALYGDFGSATVLYYLFNYEIMFVIGMAVCFIDFKKIFYLKPNFVLSIISGVLFVVLSVVTYKFNFDNKILGFLLCLIACYSVIGIMTYIFRNNIQNKAFKFMSEYTMPVFLMHTIFAAAMRSLLFKVGIDSLLIHISLGLSVAFLGPIAAAIIMRKTKWLEFLLYPSKFIKIRTRENGRI
ncbi:MAG: acyltransferase [Clostridia bacterium]|nr:acyltransferase [Clostridia bacterium]